MNSHKRRETTCKREIGPEEWLRGRDGRETVVEEALAAPMLVVAADAASTSGTAFSFRIEGFVNCLVPEKISSRFLKKMKEKKK